jgi:hypothetical protein
VPFVILQIVGQGSIFSVGGLCVVCEVHAFGDKTDLINEHVYCQVWAEAEATVER